MYMDYALVYLKMIKTRERNYKTRPWVTNNELIVINTLGGWGEGGVYIHFLTAQHTARPTIDHSEWERSRRVTWSKTRLGCTKVVRACGDFVTCLAFDLGDPDDLTSWIIWEWSTGVKTTAVKREWSMDGWTPIRFSLQGWKEWSFRSDW